MEKPPYRRRRLPKGAYPLPEGGYAVDRNGEPIVVGTGAIRVDPQWKSHPNMRLLARAFLALVEEQRQRKNPEPTEDDTRTA